MPHQRRVQAPGLPQLPLGDSFRAQGTGENTAQQSLSGHHSARLVRSCAEMCSCLSFGCDAGAAPIGDGGSSRSASAPSASPCCQPLNPPPTFSESPLSVLNTPPRREKHPGIDISVRLFLFSACINARTKLVLAEILKRAFSAQRHRMNFNYEAKVSIFDSEVSH